MGLTSWFACLPVIRTMVEGMVGESRSSEITIGNAFGNEAFEV